MPSRFFFLALLITLPTRAASLCDFSSLLRNVPVPHYQAGNEVADVENLLRIEIIPRKRGASPTRHTAEFPFQLPAQHEGQKALSHWVVGMQMWYLNGVFAVEAAQQAVKALESGNKADAQKWIARMNGLARAGTAINKLTSHMSREHYMTYVREAEKQFKEDFFGGSFREWWLFKALAFRARDLILGKIPGFEHLGTDTDLRAAREAFKGDGVKHWYKEHDEVRTRLVGQGAASLAQEKYAKDKALGIESRPFGDILEHLKTHPEEFGYHDTFFGINRDKHLSLDAFCAGLSDVKSRLDSLVGGNYAEVFSSFGPQAKVFQEDFEKGFAIYQTILAEIAGK